MEPSEEHKIDKKALKQFATSARRKLLSAVEQRAYTLGITQDEIKPLDEDGYHINGRLVLHEHYEIKQREQLIARIQKTSFYQTIEEVAYTWFNRFIAIRFMEVNDYLPTGVRVFSSLDKTKREPDVLTEIELIIDELELNREKVYAWLDANEMEKLFKYILVKQCNQLGEIMPDVFEKIYDFTELLIPEKLLGEDTVIYDLVMMISEKEWKSQVEIIGWLYQYYISERKDEVFAALKKNNKITKENIPAATQLFTPKWIVQYMVENSLGRLWLESHPDDDLKKQWAYYLDEVEQNASVKEQLDELKDKSLNPEMIQFLDPCMGSGHILVYAFDLLINIYKASGYPERQIPRLILEKNLFGLEIDERAKQMACFSLMMKARYYDQRLFRHPITLNIRCIQESNDLTDEDIDIFVDESVNPGDVAALAKTFRDAKLFGSALTIPDIDLEALKKRVESLKLAENDNIFFVAFKDYTLPLLEKLINQAILLWQKYHVVVTNPPYMGRKGMEESLSKFVKKQYPTSSADLFAVFMEVCIERTRKEGFTALINQHSWMFLSSFEKLRKKVLDNQQIYSMVHLGTRAFEEIGGEVVQSTMFVLRNRVIPTYQTIFIRLVDVKNADKKAEQFYDQDLQYIRMQDGFSDIPGSPIAYWASEQVQAIFRENPRLGDIAEPKQGLATGDNDQFLRLWFEIDIKKVGLIIENKDEGIKSKMKWFPVAKGGTFRKWYGNYDYVVNWENDGFRLRNFVDDMGKRRSVIRNPNYYFRKGMTWSTISSSAVSFRYLNYSVFETKGSVLFPINHAFFYEIFGYINTKLVNLFLLYLSPTLDFHEGPMGRVPILLTKNEVVKLLVQQNISISKSDWDSFETSWDFKSHPFLAFRKEASTLADAYANWETEADNRFNTLKANEEELNRIFIDLYGLQDELTPEVEDNEVTVRRADREREVKSFLSYCVGIVFGRYSLDEEGLTYAGGAFDFERYKSYTPDRDNVIPITDDVYFEDDIVGHMINIVRTIFGQETLEVNLDFIAESLDKKANETSRGCIRRYFLKDFYKDHVKLYKKRPIYWLFDSGKQNGFKALVYFHRYEPGLVARVRTDYLHAQERKFEEEISRIDFLLTSDVPEREKTKAKKQKAKIQKQWLECQQYDQVIAHVAGQHLDLDLDDGVKVNYNKFQGIELVQEGKKSLKVNLLSKI